jgi:hypothetical protein
MKRKKPPPMYVANLWLLALLVLFAILALYFFFIAEV